MRNINICKYINVVSIFLLSLFILMPWFIISAMGTIESHSFMTIPGVLKEGANFLTQVGGKSLAIMVLILSAVLEYMCIVVASLGIWGGVRFIINNKKSRLITASQIVAASLLIIALIAIIIIDYISATMLGGIVTVIPTVWFVICAVCLITSIVGGILYTKKVREYYYSEYSEEYYEETYEVDAQQ